MIKTILLTGATGFIGSHVLDVLLSNQFQIVLLKRTSSNVFRIKDRLADLTVYDVDTTNLQGIFNRHKFNAIVHLATLYKKYHEFSDIKNLIASNITFPLQLLDLAVKHQVNYFINTGTFFEYKYNRLPVDEQSFSNQPFNLYAMTKIAFESFLKNYAVKYGLKACTLKIFSPFGPRDNPNKLISMIIQKALQKEKISLSEGFQKLDFVYVKDIARAYLKCIQQIENFEEDYETFNIASGKAYSIRDIVSSVEEILGYRLDVKWGDPSFVDISLTVGNNKKAKEALDWEPKYTLKQGLSEVIDDFMQED